MIGSVQNYCVPGLSYYRINPLSKVDFRQNSAMTNSLQSPSTDVFVKNTNPKETAERKFNQLFPNGEFEKIYSDINNRFGVSNTPSLNLIYDETMQLGGGYTFESNSINMNLYDLMSSDKKIVGIDQYGQKHNLISPTEKLPAFVNEKLAQQFVDSANAQGSLGYTKLIVEDVTPDEQRKFIVQKIAHECIHAKQHQIIRETEGFSDKDIIKAWTHKTPKNIIESAILNQETNTRYNNSYWRNRPEAEKKYQKGSPMYNVAYAYLNAIQNYPPVTSPEYNKNLLEVEAYNLSYKYVNTNTF